MACTGPFYYCRSIYHLLQQSQTSLHSISLMLTGKETKYDKVLNNDPVSKERSPHSGKDISRTIGPNVYS